MMQGNRMCRLAKLFAIACVTAIVAPSGAQAAWTQTFADEFDGSLLDLTKWGYHSIGPRNDGFMLPATAATVGGGVLTVRTDTVLGLLHVTGQISTKQTLTLGFEQTYGYFEARVKFNGAPGMWSAFWLQSPTIGVPVGDPATAGVEMDIVEHRTRCVEAPAEAPPGICSPTSDISSTRSAAVAFASTAPSRATRRGGRSAGRSISPRSARTAFASTARCPGTRRAARSLAPATRTATVARTSSSACRSRTTT